MPDNEEYLDIKFLQIQEIWYAIIGYEIKPEKEETIDPVLKQRNPNELYDH